MSGPTRGRARRALAVLGAVVSLLVGAVGAGADPAGAASPTMTVTPGGPLQDLTPVTVTASGLTTRQLYLAAQCWGDQCSDVSFEFGPPITVTLPVEPQPDGTSSQVMGVRSSHSSWDGSTSRTVTCAEVGCSIRLLTLGDSGLEVVAVAPIDVSVPGQYVFPEAQLALGRSAGLLDGMRVGVTGSGYSWWADGTMGRYPSPTATRQVCRAVADPAPDDCERPRQVEEVVTLARSVVVGGRSGLVSAGQTMLMPRFPVLASGPWDCARQGCTVALTQQGNPVSNRVPVAFAAEWAPWPSAGTFIDQVVAKVGGRPITGSARTQLAAALTARTTTGVDAVVAAAGASSLDGDIGEVTRLYRAFFARDVESQGLAYWVGRMRAGLTALQVSRAFGGTPEFRRRYDPLTNAAVVTLAYRSTLGREPSSSDLTYWTGRLRNGLRRTDLVHSFARSPELRTRTAATVQMTILTFVLEGYTPDVVTVARGPALFVREHLLRRATEG